MLHKRFNTFIESTTIKITIEANLHSFVLHFGDNHILQIVINAEILLQNTVKHRDQYQAICNQNHT